MSDTKQVADWILADAELDGADEPRIEITTNEGMMVIDKHGRRWTVELFAMTAEWRELGLAIP